MIETSIGPAGGGGESAALTDDPRWSEDIDAPVAPEPHVGRWIGAVVVLVIVGLGVRVLVTDPNFHWQTVWSYLFSSTILNGLVITLALTAIAMAVGIVLGIFLAVMRMSPNPIVSWASRVYIWFFRGTPVLVQLIFWFNLAALFPNIGIGLPTQAFVHLNANSLIGPFTAAILGLGLNEGAYMSEIVRAGILAVGHGQVEAARALGMTRRQVMRRIVLPQAMRVIVPPTGNETIGMLKTTSLVSVIGLADLLYSAQEIYNVNFDVIPLLITVSLWYLFVTSVLTVIQSRIERYYGRGARTAFGGQASRFGPGSRTSRLFALRGR
jgi:polar amino acid transport system permease protein